ncbi:MAG: sulfatase-like hydrolase/transferase [Pirellulales bacterium]
MRAENILVIAVDGLRAAALGAYGNTAFSTPALDQLAVESLLFDWCYADAVELPAIYRSLWQTDEPLAKSLAERGYTSTLVTDEPAVLALEGAEHFHDCVQLPMIEAVRAEDVSHTALARSFAAVSEQIETSQASPRLVWVHSRGMYGPWDAPLDLQEELLAREEGDPPPADAIHPPDLLLDESDPDAAFRWSCAYAAQIMALDACIGGLCRTLAEAARDNWLVVLSGVRGFPLGEHGRVGGVDGRLYAEQLHVPMLWRFPDSSGRLARSGKLALLADLSPSLLARVRGEFRIPERDALFAAGPTGERSIRNADWSLRCEPTGAGELPGDDSCCQLFVRPDDRWEANDVASLCPEVVEGLLARLSEIPAP